MLTFLFKAVAEIAKLRTLVLCVPCDSVRLVMSIPADLNMKLFFTLAFAIAFMAHFALAGDATAQFAIQHPFFAMDNGVGRGKWTPVEQARVLKELGFDGITYDGTADLTNRLRAFQTEGLRLYAIYINAHLDRSPQYEVGLTNAIQLLRGTDAIVWLTIGEMNGSHDAEAVKMVEEVADFALAAGLRVAIYPHRGCYVATAEDALRLLKQINRPNVGLTLNLAHELVANNCERMRDIIKASAPYLYSVTLNGADCGSTFKETIKMLGDGKFDLGQFLKELNAAGYRGPIGLQCYGLKGDPKENLTRSMAAWRKLIGVEPTK